MSYNIYRWHIGMHDVHITYIYIGRIKRIVIKSIPIITANYL